MKIRDRLRNLIKAKLIHYTHDQSEDIPVIEKGHDQESCEPILPPDKEIHEALKVLELSFPVTVEEVKQAYRRLCKEYHPDRFTHDEEKQKIAHEVLVKINRAYDRVIEDVSVLE